MPTTDYVPTTTDVAALLGARTRDQYGNLVGDFSAATHPTDSQVSALISQATDEVAETIGADLDPNFWSVAKQLVTMLSAANVELSYFPEQAQANNSMYDKLMTRYDKKLKEVSENVAEDTAADTFETMAE